MNIEDKLRDALQGDAAELQPVGPGPDHARSRAFRRKRSFQSGVVVLGAVALVGGTLGVIETRSSSTAPRVATQPVAQPTSDLVWKRVAGTVLYAQHEFTSASGVTYAISTAPGSTGSNSVEPQELYSTRDGESWTYQSLGADPWLADLAESKGVLYALGTGPGAQGSTDYKLSTSTDGGAKWDDSKIPVSFTPPASDVPLQPSTSVHIARGDHTTVVMAKTSYWPDVSKVLGPDVATRPTAAGVEVFDLSACKAQRKLAAPGVGDPANLPPGACNKVVATHPWSDFGISDPAALNQQEAVVRDDGDSWQTVDLTASDAAVDDLAATSNGFVMVETRSNNTGLGSAKIFTSTDGRSWAPLAGQVPTFDTVSISGDRLIGVDNAGSKLYVSDDAGTTWIAVPDLAGLIPGNDAVEAFNTTAAVGPLGFAAVVRTAGADNGAGKSSGGTTSNTLSSPNTPNTKAPPSAADVLAHTFLLYSGDGVSWKVTNLAATGAPADGSVSDLSVGADHIDVSFQSPATRADGAVSATKLTTLVGTPKA
jgi:hypothetical protein